MVEKWRGCAQAVLKSRRFPSESPGQVEVLDEMYVCLSWNPNDILKCNRWIVVKIRAFVPREAIDRL